MTTGAISLIRQLATPQEALHYLREHVYAIPDEVFGYFIDLHLAQKSALLRHYKAKDWLAIYDTLKQLADQWTRDLPTDIVDHLLTRIDLEVKATKILALYLLAAIADNRRQQAN